MKQNAFFKSASPYIIAVAFFAILSIGYFTPDIFQGKELLQGDIRQGLGIGKELTDYQNANNGEITRWTNSLFGGMPTYQIAPSYPSSSVFSAIEKIISLGLPYPASLLFVMMLGFFLLMKSMKVRTGLAVLGALFYTFSSYFFIIIEAGHIWKFITLSYIPPFIAGIVWAYRGEYLLGGAVAALMLSLQLMNNHLQMTYYFLFVIAAIIITFFIEAWQKNKMMQFIKASAILVVAGLIGLSVNISNLYHTYQYSRESMRGPEILTPPEGQKTTGSGLDHDYIVQWSYGLGETFSLLVPNVKGGATGPLGEDKSAMEKVKPEYRQTLQGLNHYWGNQPFTSGPVYVGAFVLFLAVLAMFIVPGKLKWGLFVVTILSILLSWGKNFMWFSDIFINWFPMYNKFRTVSSILVIAEFTIPVLAILALKEWIENPGIWQEKRKDFWISFALTGGIAFLLAVMPGAFFEFMSKEEQAGFLPQAAGNPQVQDILNNLEEVRRAILSSDAWRSLLIILVGASAMVLYALKKISASVLIAGAVVLTVIDMGGIDKRYLNSSAFHTKSIVDNPFPKSPADETILADKELNFRVYNQTVNSFNDPSTSYYHKSIGGYHAAKLRRYQDLIDYQLLKGNKQVFDMLNTKYFIQPSPDTRQPIAIENPDAYGNAWFVDEIKWVNTPDEEMTALNTVNPRRVAIINDEFAKELSISNIKTDSLAGINLVEYKPNKLIYRSNSSDEGLGVFSEIYYPYGWKATIDGKETPIIRVDYLLRAIKIPGGTHEITFTFDPYSIKITEGIAYAGMALMFLLIIGAAISLFQKKNNILKS